MVGQIFVSGSVWPQDVQVIEPFRERVRLAGGLPYTYGIDEVVEKEAEFQHIVRRIGESTAMVVIHSHRYHVNGHLASLWLQREPIIAAMKGKPIFEFYEIGIKPESLLRDISINQVEFARSELLDEQGKNRIGRWIEHFFWHVDQYLHRWTPLTTFVGAAGGGILTRTLFGVVIGGFSDLWSDQSWTRSTQLAVFARECILHGSGERGAGTRALRARLRFLCSPAQSTRRPPPRTKVAILR